MKNVFISGSTGSTGFIGQRLIEMINATIGVLVRKKNNLIMPDQALNNVNTVFHLAGFTQYGT